MEEIKKILETLSKDELLELRREITDTLNVIAMNEERNQ